MKFRNSSGNINYLLFPSGPAKLFNLYRGGRKFTLFSLGSDFTCEIFIGELFGVDLAGPVRHCVYAIHAKPAINFLNIYIQELMK